MGERGGNGIRAGDRLHGVWAWCRGLMETGLSINWRQDPCDRPKLKLVGRPHRASDWWSEEHRQISLLQRAHSVNEHSIHQRSLPSASVVPVPRHTLCGPSSSSPSLGFFPLSYLPSSLVNETDFPRAWLAYYTATSGSQVPPCFNTLPPVKYPPTTHELTHDDVPADLLAIRRRRKA